jgi:hypothetical protein
MQSSIAQMLIISEDKLPSDEQLIESVIASVKYMQETEGFELDKEVIVTMCELAVNIRNTVENPEKYININDDENFLFSVSGHVIGKYNSTRVFIFHNTSP